MNGEATIRKWQCNVLFVSQSYTSDWAIAKYILSFVAGQLSGYSFMCILELAFSSWHTERFSEVPKNILLPKDKTRGQEASHDHTRKANGNSQKINAVRYIKESLSNISQMKCDA